MKITDLHVAAFGAWQDLDLHALSGGATVFYGLNETGKTTLMHFARSMLYGFEAARHRRYVPPAKGGKAGGSIRLESKLGNYQIRRTSGTATGSGTPADEVTVIGAEGASTGPQTLQTLLGGVDEAIFNNVFAVGLHEIQELGTLDDTEAARLLYDLSAGLDRVSLFDVLRELAACRRGILAEDEQECQVSRLVVRREKLRGEIAQFSGDGERLAQLLAGREQLQQSIAKREEEARRIAEQARLFEAGVNIAPRWRRRGEIDGQIAALGAIRPIDEAGLPLLERLAGGLEKRQQRHAELAQTYQSLRDQAAGVGLNRALWRQAARIEALNEQLPWLENIEQDLHKLDAEAGVLERQVSTEQAQLGLTDGAGADRLRLLSSGSLETLKAARRNLHDARQSMQRLSKASKEIDHDAAAASAELTETLTRRGIRDLQAAIEKSGDTVNKLRRRIQLEERLGQLKRTTTELEGQMQEWMHRQMLPPWPLFATGAVFVLGFVLLLLGFFLPQVTAAGMWLGFLGLIGLGIAAGTKWFLETQSRQSLDVCQEQLDLAKQQTKQATDEAAQIDRQLPSGGGTYAVRLQAAERELGELENLLPLDAKAKSRGQGAAGPSERFSQAQAELARAKKRWREALASCGLPEGYTLKQVRHLLARRGDVADLRGRLTQHRQLLEQRRGQYASLVQRTRSLAKDAGFNLQDENPAQIVAKLLAALQGQEVLHKKRRDLLAQARKTRRRAAKIARQIRKLRRLRRGILDQAGAVDDADYRRLYEAHRQCVELKQQREQIQAEIAAALTGKCTEEAVARLFLDLPPEQLEPGFAELRSKLQSSEDQLKRLYQERGELNAEVRALAADRRLGIAQLELKAVEEQLSTALDRWQVLAVANLVLDTIRREYEAHRQPEALQEASKYLQRLTLGRYRRVWVPLGEHALHVDDHDNQTLPVELLSSGTREQLFLALRLAMAAAYAKKGVVLPLILDDVLVNFDGERAAAAARVLCDFAAAGRQVLVFTCHEHIEQIFRRLNADVRRLGEMVEPPVAQPVVVTPPRLPDKPRKKRRPLPIAPSPPRPRVEPRPSAQAGPVVFSRRDAPEKPRPVFVRWTTPAWDPAIEVPIEDEERTAAPLDELAADAADEVPWWYEYQQSTGESEAA
jgi:uncharacterized protein YhaN